MAAVLFQERMLIRSGAVIKEVRDPRSMCCCPYFTCFAASHEMHAMGRKKRGVFGNSSLVDVRHTQLRGAYSLLVWVLYSMQGPKIRPSRSGYYLTQGESHEL